MKQDPEKTLKLPKTEKSEKSDQDSNAAAETSTKPIYKKPQLKKYTQIDYVSAYGVDD